MAYSGILKIVLEWNSSEVRFCRMGSGREIQLEHNFSGFVIIASVQQAIRELQSLTYFTLLPQERLTYQYVWGRYTDVLTQMTQLLPPVAISAVFNRNKPPQPAGNLSTTNRFHFRKRFLFPLPQFTDDTTEQSKLQYQCQQWNGTMLPIWLQYSDSMQLLIGDPSSNSDLLAELRKKSSGAQEYNVSLALVAFDGYQYGYQYFNLTVYNTAPKIISQIEDANVHLDKQFSVRVKSGVVSDEDESDQEHLSIVPYLINGSALAVIPPFISFNSKTGNFFGTPTGQNLYAECAPDQFRVELVLQQNWRSETVYTRKTVCSY